MNEWNAFRWVLPLTALACVGRDETNVALNYDYGTLSAYRSAIPTEERLVASVPAAAADNSMAAADPAAVLAEQGVVFARGINLTARDVARTLTDIAGQPPTDFDSARGEFVWGPWQNPSGPGELLLQIRKSANPLFEYDYELARQMPERPDTRLAVLWGSSDPDPDDANLSPGLTVLDLNGNAAFDTAYGGDTTNHGQGRFGMLYGHKDRGAASVYFNLATFQNFVPFTNGPEGQAAPVDVEHFFGRMADPSGTVLDFLQSEIDANLCGDTPGSCFGAIPGWHNAERFVFGEFLVNSGPGRAEVLLSGGDLSSQVQMTECWDESLTRTSYQVRTDEMAMQMVESASCPGRAAQSSEELGLPTPDAVQPWLRAALDCAMEAGAFGCQ